MKSSRKDVTKIYNIDLIAHEVKKDMTDYSIEAIEKFIDTLLIPTSVGTNATYGEVNTIRKNLIKKVYLKVNKINDN